MFFLVRIYFLILCLTPLDFKQKQRIIGILCAILEEIYFAKADDFLKFMTENNQIKKEDLRLIKKNTGLFKNELVKFIMDARDSLPNLFSTPTTKEVKILYIHFMKNLTNYTLALLYLSRYVKNNEFVWFCNYLGLLSSKEYDIIIEYDYMKNNAFNIQSPINMDYSETIRMKFSEKILGLKKMLKLDTYTGDPIFSIHSN